MRSRLRCPTAVCRGTNFFISSWTTSPSSTVSCLAEPYRRLVEVITWRLRSSGGKDQVTRPHQAQVADALKGKRSVYFNELGAYVETPVYDHYKLPLDQPVKGPAIIEQRESTAVVGPSGIAHVDGHGNLVINIL